MQSVLTVKHSSGVNQWLEALVLPLAAWNVLPDVLRRGVTSDVPDHTYTVGQKSWLTRNCRLLAACPQQRE